MSEKAESCKFIDTNEILQINEETTNFQGPETTAHQLQRGTWKNKWDFLFSCISLSVGLGNVWRFPYLCYKNGGGVFLIIYLISMFFCGIPLFLLEVSMGQYLGAGGMTAVSHFCPMLKGVGIATMVMVTWYNTYYCVIISWSLYYLLASFISIPDLPWNTCNGDWNTADCWMPTALANGTLLEKQVNHYVTPVEEFWNNQVLGINDGLEYGLGDLQWVLVGTLLLGWLLVYLIICRGLHQSGYIIWFTALFPYVIMFILLIRALTLDGAVDGLLAYVQVDWSYFLNATAWIDSATQIFFAYSIGTGALSALGSYNKFNHDCFRDALITCVVNTCTCLTAGVLVFAILGHMAHLQGTSVNEVVNSGPGLVFLTYPELVLSLPASFFWSIIFFTMLLVLGIDTEFCSVESLITGIVDNWSSTLLPYRKQVTLATCIILFLLGLPMVTQGGVYLFQLMDFYSASGLPLLWICFFETVAVAWFYGVRRFRQDLEKMLGYKPSYFLIFCWAIFTPLVMAKIFIFYCFSYSPVTYGSHYQYPQWAEVMGLLISFSSMIWVPLYAVYYISKQEGSLLQRLKRGITPKLPKQRDESQPQGSRNVILL